MSALFLSDVMIRGTLIFMESYKNNEAMKKQEKKKETVKRVKEEMEELNKQTNKQTFRSSSNTSGKVHE
jgi:quinol monooxygenase YgiN